MNLYGFASGDPVNFSDPFGLCPPEQQGNCTQSDVSAQDIPSSSIWSMPSPDLHVLETGCWRAGNCTQSRNGVEQAVAHADFVNSFGLGLMGLAGGIEMSGAGLARGIAKTIKGAQGADVDFSRIGNFVRGVWEVPGEKGVGYVRWNKILNQEGKTVRMFKDVYDQGGNFLRRDWKLGGPP